MKRMRTNNEALPMVAEPLFRDLHARAQQHGWLVSRRPGARLGLWRNTARTRIEVKCNPTTGAFQWAREKSPEIDRKTSNISDLYDWITS